SSTAPSIWYAAVATPQRNPGGKLVMRELHVSPRCMSSMHSRSAIEKIKKTQFTRVAAVVAAAAALPLIVPAMAVAGGPTSVLLVSPGRHATASLYATDEAYTR